MPSGSFSGNLLVVFGHFPESKLIDMLLRTLTGLSEQVKTGEKMLQEWSMK